jgi:hypothetical protein
VLGAAIAVLVVASIGSAAASLAIFSWSRAPTDIFVTDQLNPPTNLAATVTSATVALGWTATTDTYAAGHRVLRGTASGGPYGQIVELTPRTTTTYSDSPGTGTFYYVARAFAQNWESVNSTQISAVVATIVEVGSRWFCAAGDTACQVSDNGDIDVVTTIPVGGSVRWNWLQGGHSVTACSDVTFGTCGAAQGFDSGVLGSGTTFVHTFSAAGTSFYLCSVHPIAMRGQVDVTP